MAIVMMQVKIMLAILLQAVRNIIEIRIIKKVRRMKNHRKNENGIRKRKKHQQIKTPEKEKKIKHIYNGR